MTAQRLIEVLEKLLKLHKSLYKIGVEKTEIIKKGDIKSLQLSMANEKKHINAIGMLENERIKIVSDLFPDKINPTLEEYALQLEQSDRENIMMIQQQLITILRELKSVNSLNQELLQQSLQYITLNLDLLLPNDQSNYSKELEGEEPLSRVSLFDSKA